MILPAGLNDAGEFSPQSQFPKAETAYAENSVVTVVPAAEFATVDLAGFIFIPFLQLSPLTFASHLSFLLLRPESHTNHFQQLVGTLVLGGGGDDGDVQTAVLVDLVVIDLRKVDLILESQGVVASTIKGLVGHAFEVTDTGEDDGNQSIQKLVHPIVP